VSTCDLDTPRRPVVTYPFPPCLFLLSLNGRYSVAMGILIWIILSGSRSARSWKYEFFIINHIFSVLLFLAFYFIHTNNYLNSWRYLWAATYLWAAAVLIRWCQSSLASRYFVHMKASVELTLASSEMDDEGDVIRIAINTPIKWKP
jgi:ferric-chelate reductase